MNSLIKRQLALLPTQPGCYLMKNEEGLVIYVGKAKNLKNRVRSYFVGAHNEKTTKLVSEIRSFTYVMTHSEHESLILELNLIKQYSPKYNIRLMDDKTYPYIEITDEAYPKLQVVRQKQMKGKVFGPYPNVYSARETVNMLNRIYPLRKCETLPKQACLYFHIGQCLAPCIKKEVDYQPYVDQIIRFLKGDTKEVLKTLKEEMEAASLLMNFEKAAEFRDMIQHIENTTEKQTINLNDHQNRDVIAFAHNEADFAIEIFKLRQGRLIDHMQQVFSYTLDVHEEVMSYLNQMYEHDMPDELLCHPSLEASLMKAQFGSKVVYPQKGDKKQLTELAYKNAKKTLENHFILNRYEGEQKNKALIELSKFISKEVSRIDVIDNAQLFGTAPISAVIVYEDLNFNKKEYRKYHLKTTENDDYQAMREVIYRRYQRHLIENLTLPSLILVDGGIGQMHAAMETLATLNLNIPVAGLKKNRSHQLEALVIQNETIMLKTNSVLYKFLGKLSEEVHRFAIDFHRKTRNKQAFQSPLDVIKGIGPKRKARLIQTFGNLDNMKLASDAQLKEIGLSEDAIQQLRNMTV
jgi:excinuclease ABC subunit C